MNLNRPTDLPHEIPKDRNTPVAHNHTGEGSEPQTPAEVRIALSRLAYASVQHGIDRGRALTPDLDGYRESMPVLIEPRATFVTIRHHQDLVGCIGTLQPVRPLAQDVSHNAYAAGFEDPRSPGVTRSMLPHLDIHISLLNPPRVLECETEQDLLTQLRPGVDGLILEDGFRRATFLPAVWESIGDPVEFVHQLKRKAGLAPDHWSNTMKCSCYTVESIP
ncbi:MAG: AmmeMemoRadiSam system protein A [Planctomycetes bacterium]|nr:AmmeMemoRadiSam system protein A [Planctomycetota bacterium]NOG55057.1 AmmeMemoRadiSam system protein A [Planctomycetota bacterium]